MYNEFNQIQGPEIQSIRLAAMRYVQSLEAANSNLQELSQRKLEIAEAVLESLYGEKVASKIKEIELQHVGEQASAQLTTL